MSTPSPEERRDLMQSITDILAAMGYHYACKRADGIYYERHVDGVRLNSAKIGLYTDRGPTIARLHTDGAPMLNGRVALFNHFGIEGVGCLFHGTLKEFTERYSASPEPVTKRLSTTIRKLTRG